MQITTIGLDIAKNVFQVHGIDAAEKVVVRKQLRRGQVLKFFASLPPCLIGMEACAGWSREGIGMLMERAEQEGYRVVMISDGPQFAECKSEYKQITGHE